jgi:hypothetical protein
MTGDYNPMFNGGWGRYGPPSFEEQYEATLKLAKRINAEADRKRDAEARIAAAFAPPVDYSRGEHMAPPKWQG